MTLSAMVVAQSGSKRKPFSLVGGEIRRLLLLLAAAADPAGCQTLEAF